MRAPTRDRSSRWASKAKGGLEDATWHALAFDIRLIAPDNSSIGSSHEWHAEGEGTHGSSAHPAPSPSRLAFRIANPSALTHCSYFPRHYKYGRDDCHGNGDSGLYATVRDVVAFLDTHALTYGPKAVRSTRQDRSKIPHRELSVAGWATCTGSVMDSTPNTLLLLTRWCRCCSP
jgi:hypothetical protein